MREILFRGKRIDNGEWVYGFASKGRYYHYKGNTLQPSIDHEDKGVMCTSIVKPETIGQFTGLTDCYNNRIFEGDILEDIASERGVVKWCDAMFVIDFDDTYINFNEVRSCDYKVVGNIYDNPG